ncbi:HNH endonuclease [Streptomyces sp. NPDC053493]|uniref:HNH endonuclease n=1 Tax=Streptomyces sp. NPDC053493 TaxID=3365705 RepID=UPI0037D577C4
MAPVAGNPRNGRPYRDLCTWLRSQALPCWICGRDINYALKGKDAQRSRWAFTLDHAQPLSRGGALLDRANARAAHRACNSGRGNRMRPAESRRASRRW